MVTLRLVLCLILALVSCGVVKGRPAAFQQDFRVTWSEYHIRQIDGGRTVQLVLDQNSGQIIGSFTPTLAEATSTREALSWLKSLNLSHIIVESDAFHGHESLSSSLGLVIYDCKSLVQDVPFSSFVFLNRSTNQAAHDVAGEAVSMSGCGFASKYQYLFGRVSMKIKLVPGDSAGTVAAFYMISKVFGKRDELDFEFLGNRSGQPYTVQTNVYANGKGDREQRINLWFDPSTRFHEYSIHWNHQHIVFSVDGVPIRVFKNNEARGVAYPKFQPMGIYSTLWEADDWATRGGLEKIDWSKAPFNAYYTDFNVEGCRVPGPTDCASNLNNWWEGAAYKALSPEAARQYRWVRINHMIYDYCTDRARYPVPPPECYAGI